MKHTRVDQRFFRSTRGQIVSLLRGGPATVEDLANQLHLTDNAVRAHLATLERDGLVDQKGVRRSVRKPHFEYGLTADGEHLFPKAYDALLNQLLDTLKTHLPAAELETVLKEVGRSLARAEGSTRAGDIESRVRQASEALKGLGGAPQLERDDKNFVIRSASCPLSVAVTKHPEVCQVVEALVGYIVGRRVKEHCDRADLPRCRFEFAGK
jgi:predicted ArsR family transcriptional regulator